MQYKHPDECPGQEAHLTRGGIISCKGHKRNGKPCTNAPIHGAAVCRMHGGGNKATKAKAAKNVGLANAKAAVATYGLPVDVDPVDALLQELARTNGHVLWLGERIKELKDGDIIWGKIATTDRAGDEENSWTEEKVGAAAHLWVELYFRERQHIVRLSDLMVKNGLAEMQVVLQAQQIEVFESAMLAMLGDLAIDSSDPRIRVIIGQRLTEAAKAAAQPLEIPVR